MTKLQNLFICYYRFKWMFRLSVCNTSESLRSLIFTLKWWKTSSLQPVWWCSLSGAYILQEYTSLSWCEWLPPLLYVPLLNTFCFRVQYIFLYWKYLSTIFQVKICFVYFSAKFITTKYLFLTKKSSKVQKCSKVKLINTQVKLKK